MTAPLHAYADALSHGGGILADAAAKHDSLRATENCKICPQILAGTVTEHVDRQLSPSIPTDFGIKQVPHIARTTGHS
jgi:hypothetical protein